LRPHYEVIERELGLAGECGPFAPEPGLALCVHALNGHQASESYTIRSIRSQLVSWLRTTFGS